MKKITEIKLTAYNTGSRKCLLHYHFANTSGGCPNPLFTIWSPLKIAAQDKRQLTVRKEIKMAVAKTEDKEIKTAAQEIYA
jgi:hypothetical protein